MKRDEKWLSHYEQAKKYYIEHGSLVNIGDYMVDGFNVGYWVRNQRRTYFGKGHCRLEEWQIKLLDEIDIRWDFEKDTWNINYELLKDYYKKHGNSNIARSYKVKNVNIGTWLYSQKFYHKTHSELLSGKQIKLLNEIEVDWHPHCTSLFRKKITPSFKKKYYEKLKKITLEYLDDLKYEDINEIDSKDKQKKIEDILLKRIFR